MRTILLILAVISCMSQKAKASESNQQTPDNRWTMTASAGILQRQILPNGFVLHDGAIARYSIDMENHTNGFYIHLVTQVDLDHYDVQEIDGVLGITNTFLDHYRYDLSLMRDHNTEDRLNDFWRFHLKVGLDTDESQRRFRINPYVSITSFLVEDDSEHMESGSVFSLAIEDVWRVTEKLSLSIPIGISYDTGVAHSKSGALVSTEINIQYKVTRDITLEAGYTGYFGHHCLQTVLAASVRWHF